MVPILQEPLRDEKPRGSIDTTVHKFRACEKLPSNQAVNFISSVYSNDTETFTALPDDTQLSGEFMSACRSTFSVFKVRRERKREG